GFAQKLRLRSKRDTRGGRIVHTRRSGYNAPPLNFKDGGPIAYAPFGQRKKRSTYERETDTDSFHHYSFDPRSHRCRATGSSRTHGEEACLYRQGGLAHDQSGKLPAPWWFYQGGPRGDRAHAGSQGRSQSRE